MHQRGTWKVMDGGAECMKNMKRRKGKARGRAGREGKKKKKKKKNSQRTYHFTDRLQRCRRDSSIVHTSLGCNVVHMCVNVSMSNNIRITNMCIEW